MCTMCCDMQMKTMAYMVVGIVIAGTFGFCLSTVMEKALESWLEYLRAKRQRNEGKMTDSVSAASANRDCWSNRKQQFLWVILPYLVVVLTIPTLVFWVFESDWSFADSLYYRPAKRLFGWCLRLRTFVTSAFFFAKRANLRPT